jgi:DNA-binding NarL/FixJ family response regulator
MIFGAHGFLEQDRSREMLLRAIQFLAQGQLWIAPDVLEVYLREVAAALRHSQQGRGTSFTPHEVQILEMVRSRLSNREIAGLLKIRISTVKFHLTNIRSKQHAGCRQELSPLHSEIWNKLAPDHLLRRHESSS